MTSLGSVQEPGVQVPPIHRLAGSFYRTFARRGFMTPPYYWGFGYGRVFGRIRPGTGEHADLREVLCSQRSLSLLTPLRQRSQGSTKPRSSEGPMRQLYLRAQENHPQCSAD